MLSHVFFFFFFFNDTATTEIYTLPLHDALPISAGTVMKTSNLVWILTAELLDVARGKPVLADSYELKGDATRMGPAGADVFAQRVVKAVTQRQAAVDP